MISKSRPRLFLSSLWRSILARPLTTLYLAASVVIVSGFTGWIDVNTALIVLTIMFFILLTLGLHRENKLESKVVKAELDTIHMLVNSQHDVLVERVDQLIATLEHAGVAVPEQRKST